MGVFFVVVLVSKHRNILPMNVPLEENLCMYLMEGGAANILYSTCSLKMQVLGHPNVNITQCSPVSSSGGIQLQNTECISIVGVKSSLDTRKNQVGLLYNMVWTWSK